MGRFCISKGKQAVNFKTPSLHGCASRMYFVSYAVQYLWVVRHERLMTRREGKKWGAKRKSNLRYTDDNTLNNRIRGEHSDNKDG